MQVTACRTPSSNWFLVHRGAAPDVDGENTIHTEFEAVAEKYMRHAVATEDNVEIRAPDILPWAPAA